MWKAMDGRVALEPGEIDALVVAARQQAESVPEWHPRRAMLLAVADAFQRMVDGGGVVVLRTPVSVQRAAARALVLGSGEEPVRRLTVGAARRRQVRLTGFLGSATAVSLAEEACD